MEVCYEEVFGDAYEVGGGEVVDMVGFYFRVVACGCCFGSGVDGLIDEKSLIGVECHFRCHWSVNVNALELLQSQEVRVRAFDSAHQTQPDEPVWNLGGEVLLCRNMWCVRPLLD